MMMYRSVSARSVLVTTRTDTTFFQIPKLKFGQWIIILSSSQGQVYIIHVWMKRKNCAAADCNDFNISSRVSKEDMAFN